MSARRRSRVLFLAPRYPLPATRGDQRRVLHLVEGIARHADVLLACFGSGPRLQARGVRTRTRRRGLVTAALGNLARPAPSLPLQVRLFLDGELQRAVRRECDDWEPDVVHATLARMAPYVPARGPFHRHIDFVDALSLNMRTRSTSSPAPARALFGAEAALMERYEARLAASFDTSSVVAEADRLANPGLARATVIPNGVDREAFPFVDPATRPARLLFFGNLGYFHNVAPACFVAEQVLPLVRERVPDAELTLAGARPHASVARLDSLEGVSVHPDVASMADELHGAAVAVLPMFSGSGMKNKVLEAFCAGTPVVANAAGIDGVSGAHPRRNYLAAEGAEAIADACVELLQAPELRSELAGAASELVEDRYGWQRQVDVLLGLYGIDPA